VHMLCDPLRLAQVLQTLLENATRNTPAGGSISLQVHQVDQELVIEVRDDGVGIPPRRVPSLFNMFAQREGAAANSDDCHGINLAITRQIVELHGGTIEGRSDGVGRGSQFTIRLPVITDAPPPAIPRQAGKRRPRRIMVIDDHEDSASSLCEFFAAEGHSVLAARTGELALVLAQSFCPEAAVIDLGLPGIDGFEVGRRMREGKVTERALLIAITGFSIKQFRELSAYSVFRHYLLKPASPDTLLQVIENTLEDAEKV
jgi:CheY-like chemotaxis protein